MRTSRTARRATALLLAGATAFALGACGSEGDPAAEEPTSGVETSASPTETPEPAGPVELTQATFAEAIAASQESLTSAHMEMTYGGDAAVAAGMAGAPIVADINYAAAPPEMHMTMSLEGMGMDLILVGGEAYIGMGDLTEGKYLYLTEAEMAADPNFADMALDTDFGAQAAGFAAGITSFEKTGTETLNGIDVTVYTMTVDPSKIDPEAASLDAETMLQVGEMTVVYWLDANNIPHKADVTLDLAGQPMTMSTVLSKINEPVTITAPAVEETIPYAEMMG